MKLNRQARYHLIEVARKAMRAAHRRTPEEQGRHILDALSHFHSALSAILGVPDDFGAQDPAFTRYEEAARAYLWAGTGFAEEPIDG